jgi:hypothetical protein
MVDNGDGFVAQVVPLQVGGIASSLRSSQRHELGSLLGNDQGITRVEDSKTGRTAVRPYMGV